MVKIYKLISLSRPKDIYIGACTCELNARLSQHKWDAKNKNSKKSLWLKSIIESTNDLAIIFIDNIEKEHYSQLESYYIDLYSKTHNILNTSLNCHGIVLNRSLESIARTSKGKMQPILQYEKNGTFIKEWDSIRDAAIFYNKKSHTAIGNCLNGLTPYSCGYSWKYKNKPTRQKVYIGIESLIGVGKYEFNITNKEKNVTKKFKLTQKDLVNKAGLTLWQIRKYLMKGQIVSSEKYIVELIRL